MEERKCYLGYDCKAMGFCVRAYLLNTYVLSGEQSVEFIEEVLKTYERIVSDGGCQEPEQLQIAMEGVRVAIDRYLKG